MTRKEHVVSTTVLALVVTWVLNALSCKVTKRVRHSFRFQRSWCVRRESGSGGDPLKFDSVDSNWKDSLTVSSKFSDLPWWTRKVPLFSESFYTRRVVRHPFFVLVYRWGTLVPSLFIVTSVLSEVRTFLTDRKEISGTPGLHVL